MALACLWNVGHTGSLSSMPPARTYDWTRLQGPANTTYPVAFVVKGYAFGRPTLSLAWHNIIMSGVKLNPSAVSFQISHCSDRHLWLWILGYDWASAISSPSGRDGIFAKSSQCDATKCADVKFVKPWMSSHFSEERSQLRWFGHASRISQGRLSRRVLLAAPTGKRRRGRPRVSWRDYRSPTCLIPSWCGASRSTIAKKHFEWS